MRLQAGEDVLLQAKKHPVDGFELQPFIVDILQFDQSVARGMVQADFGFHPFPDGFGRGKRVVAVTHGEQQDRFILTETIFCSKDFRFRQLAQGGDHLRLQRLIDRIPGQVTGTKHQIEIVEFFQPALWPSPPAR